MAIGLGLSIGTVNTVSALAEVVSARAGHGRWRRCRRARAVTRRTTLTFDSTGLVRVGMIPRHGRAITEFADLTRRSAVRARVGHRSLSQADLIALVADSVIGEALPDGCGTERHGIGIALAYPVYYGSDHIGDLRAALDGQGLGAVALVAEPVAAAAWLDAERGPLMPGLALVYDLGGSGLDITLVRVGAGCPTDPIVGEPVRSTDFGGQAFGALIAARVGRLPSALPFAGVIDGSVADVLRAEHIRDSLELVYRCLSIADVTMADVDCVLVVGGAARPVEVAQVLAGALARPVIIAPDPERTIADGAALLGRRAAAAAEGRVGAHPIRWGIQRAVLRARALSRRIRRGFVEVAVAAGLSDPQVAPFARERGRPAARRSAVE
ncbi:hypothetical protein D5S18_28850 [Nocardia panacis]|uniref:Uncharacterized protein n=1 Tax=Nocardia panacis TaxID=2340916 RepID=A0A3A4KKW1_9NOCA|nr:FGGY-family carbohydrate kinase [Nocardia panacis]RJO69899.1 hypothetical protein D5S18_28850 [Nocardia panacis]